MKNNLKKLLFYFFVLSINLNFNALTSEINFEAKNIDTVEGDFIKASDNVFIYDNEGNKIYSDKLIIDNSGDEVCSV